MEWVRDENGIIVKADSYFDRADRPWAIETERLLSVVRKEVVSEPEEELSSPSELIELGEEVRDNVDAVTDVVDKAEEEVDWMKYGGTLKSVKAAVVALGRLGLAGDLTVRPPHTPKGLSEGDRAKFELNFSEILSSGLEVTKASVPEDDSDAEKLVIDDSSVVTDDEVVVVSGPTTSKRKAGSDEKLIKSKKLKKGKSVALKASRGKTVSCATQTDLSAVSLYGERLTGFNFLYEQIKDKLSDEEISELKFPSLSVGESVSARKNRRNWIELDIEEEVLVSTKTVAVSVQNAKQGEKKNKATASR